MANREQPVLHKKNELKARPKRYRGFIYPGTVESLGCTNDSILVATSQHYESESYESSVNESQTVSQQESEKGYTKEVGKDR
jgi:hypothetical protein